MRPTDSGQTYADLARIRQARKGAGGAARKNKRRALLSAGSCREAPSKVQVPRTRKREVEISGLHGSRGFGRRCRTLGKAPAVDRQGPHRRARPAAARFVRTLPWPRAPASRSDGALWQAAAQVRAR